MNVPRIRDLLVSKDWVRSHCGRCRTKARTHKECCIEWLLLELDIWKRAYWAKESRNAKC